MPPREKKKREVTPLTIGLGVGAAGCFALAIGLWATSAISQRQTAALSPVDGLIEDADLVTEEHDGVPLSDEEVDDLMANPWDGAEEAYPGLAAWVEVGGTDISTPVMRATEDAPDWFLNHDAFGNENASGLPYLDFRCNPESVLQVVYAHNLGWGSSEGFGTLADAWQQEVFEGIGTVRWASLSPASQNPDAPPDEGDGPDGSGGVTEYRPICALKIDGEESDIFDFDLSDHGMTEWLDGILPRASAVTSGGKVGGAMSNHLLALVTCSGDGYPSQSRTIVLLGDADAIYFDRYGDLYDGVMAFAEKADELTGDE